MFGFGPAAMESDQLVDGESKDTSTDYNALFGGKEEAKFTQKTVFGEVWRVCAISLECVLRKRARSCSSGDAWVVCGALVVSCNHRRTCASCKKKKAMWLLGDALLYYNMCIHIAELSLIERCPMYKCSTTECMLDRGGYMPV